MKSIFVCEDPMNVVLQERRVITGKDVAREWNGRTLLLCEYSISI